MEIVAPIPVRRISNGITYYFECEKMMAGVVRVMRYRCDSSMRERYYYSADIVDPPAIHPDAVRCGTGNTYRVNINRRLNPKWNPPKFADGSNCVEFAQVLPNTSQTPRD